MENRDKKSILSQLNIPEKELQELLNISEYKTIRKGDYNISQPFAQGQFCLTEKLTFNAGIHGQYFRLTNNFRLNQEPHCPMQ